MDPTATVPQDRVEDFDVFNVFFSYDFTFEDALIDNTRLTLNINNVLDEDPPLYEGTSADGSAGFANDFTIGRLFMLGVSARF